MDRVETERSDAKRTAQDLASKIKESNSRAEEQTRKLEETSLNNSEDSRYETVMKELEHVKQELGKLKLDMARVLKEKRRAERAAKASGSKARALSTSMDLIKNEIQKLSDEQVLAELARLEAVKECAAIEAQRKDDANKYKTKLDENKMAKELHVTLSDVNFLENELKNARKNDGSPLNTLTEELKAAKSELAAVKREGFEFMAAMDVVRGELKHAQYQKAKLERAERKRDVSVQNLNAKILRARAKLETLTGAARKSGTVVNLCVALEQLRAEAERLKDEKDVMNNETENAKAEVAKTEYEMELVEERLEAAMEELGVVKTSELKALENLKGVVEGTVEARDMAMRDGLKITITGFEYDYLMGKASVASEIADKKVAAAQAWVEALSANEKEVMMRVEMARVEIMELEEDEEEYRSEPLEAQRSVCRVRKTGLVRRASLQRVRIPAVRHGRK